MPADCKPYYYTGNFKIVKENSRFFNFFQSAMYSRTR